jgi:epoxyqueuosine reductase
LLFSNIWTNYFLMDPASSHSHIASQQTESAMLNKRLKEALAEGSKMLGFDQAVILPISVLEEESKRLQQWLTEGHQADMQWMETHFDKRRNPAELMPEAQSVVCLTINYYTPDAVSDSASPSPKIAKYALGLDYHRVIRKKLKQLLKHLQAIDPTLQGRGVTDSAPLLEKALAVRAGLGWQGKNSLIIHPRKGSWFFLAELLLNRSFEDTAETNTSKLPEECPPMMPTFSENRLPPQPTESLIKNHCGKCQRCIDACPTDAIAHPFVVDSNKCIAYWTIESKADTFPEQIQNNLNHWVFGCDICQDVCPWNVRFSQETEEAAFQPLTQETEKTATWFLALSEQTFQEAFSRTPLKRTGLERLKRNVRLAFPEET